MVDIIPKFKDSHTRRLLLAKLLAIYRQVQSDSSFDGCRGEYDDRLYGTGQRNNEALLERFIPLRPRERTISSMSRLPLKALPFWYPLGVQPEAEGFAKMIHTTRHRTRTLKGHYPAN